MNVPPPIEDRHRPGRPSDGNKDRAAASEGEPEFREHGGIRKMIWVYFWLLILEGALRKWFLPQFTNQLLLVRDPVVIMIYVMALSGKIFPWNNFITWTAVLSVLGAFASIFADHGNPLVTLYGLRTNFLHLPLIFIVPKVFNLTDVEKIGKWLFITAIPMALLVALQFRSSPGAWVNVGVGASEGSQLTVGFGRIRPPGTFSFTTGLALYLSILAAFVMSWQLKRGSIKSALALSAIPAAGLMIAVSGSRGVLTAVSLIVVGTVAVCARKPVFFGKGVRAALLIGVVFFGLQLRSEVRMGMIVHETRITTSGGVRAGMVDRVFGSFLEPFVAIRDTPILGQGIGLGTGVGSGLVRGERIFLLAETEWLRVVKESGPILGFAYLALRIAIVVAIGLQAYRALEDENPLPMILFCAVSPMVLSGQFGVPTTLGFATFGAGLCLAAANLPRTATESGLFRISPESVTNPNRTVRGRSIYAEKLHGR